MKKSTKSFFNLFVLFLFFAVFIAKADSQEKNLPANRVTPLPNRLTIFPDLTIGSVNVTLVGSDAGISGIEFPHDRVKIEATIKNSGTGAVPQGSFIYVKLTKNDKLVDSIAVQNVLSAPGNSWVYTYLETFPHQEVPTYEYKIAVSGNFNESANNNNEKSYLITEEQLHPGGAPDFVIGLHGCDKKVISTNVVNFECHVDVENIGDGYSHSSPLLKILKSDDNKLLGVERIDQGDLPGPRSENRFTVTFKNTDIPKGAYNAIAQIEPVVNESNKSNNTSSNAVEINNPLVGTPPSNFTFCGKNPDNSQLGDVDAEEIQGIAHSETYWYLSNKWRIYKTNKNNIKSVVKYIKLTDIQNKIGGGKVDNGRYFNDYNHFGDIDIYNDTLYVPTTGIQKKIVIDSNHKPFPPEFWIEISQLPSLVVVFDKNLSFIKYGIFSRLKQKGAGWLAINPIDGYLYSAEPYRSLHVYNRRFNNGDSLKDIGDISLNFKYAAMSEDEWEKVYDQGGAFSPHGIFYYVLDHKSDEYSENTGIHAFSIYGNSASEIRITGKNNKDESVNFMNFKYDPDFVGNRLWELEGITVWDLGNEGQIHMFQLHNEPGNEDDVHLFHYKVNNDY